MFMALRFISGWCTLFVYLFFSYVPGRKILDGVSFVVPAGKSVAIVGTSGSGKTSDVSRFFKLAGTLLFMHVMVQSS